MKIIHLTILTLSFIGCSSIKKNKEVTSLIERALDRCEISSQKSALRMCIKQKSKIYPLVNRLGSNKVLPTLIYYFNHGSTKEKKIVTSLIQNIKEMIGDIYKNPTLLKNNVMEEMFTALEDSQKNNAQNIVPIVTYIAILKKKEDKLFNIANKHKISSVRNSIYRYSMKYGQLRLFDKVSEISSTAKDPSLRISALSSLIVMQNYSKKEKEIICGWSASQLNGKRNTYEITELSRVLLLRCSGKYINNVLDKAQKLAKKKKLRRHSLAYLLRKNRTICDKNLIKQKKSTFSQCHKLNKIRAQLK